MGFLAKQPNGLYCYVDDIDDQPTAWNLSESEYIESCIANAKIRARENLKNAHEFSDVYESFTADEKMSEEDFNTFLKEVGCNRKYEDLMGFWNE